jgi:DNA-directed RNA polymerase beta' subunit
MYLKDVEMQQRLLSSMILRIWVIIWLTVAGCRFNLDDVIIPEDQREIVSEGYAEVEEVIANYNMGFITNNERYNQVLIFGHMPTRNLPIR